MYVLPQVEVFQDFQTVPTAAATALAAHISGPHAFLARYAQADERDAINLGFYDPAEDHEFEWPGLPPGGLVDFGYVTLWIQDALLQYFQHLIGSGSQVLKVDGVNNQVRANSVNFATGSGYARDAALLDRDVQIGDVARVRGVGTGGSITLWTYVKGLLGDPVAASIEAATADADNPATQSSSSSIAQSAGDLNCVTAGVDASGYAGLASGQIVETYDLLVTDSSVDGDFTTATVRVISGSGTDDVATLFPEPAGTPTPIGTRGLFVTWNTADAAACSASATVEAVSPNDLLGGQRWHVVAHQAFTRPAATASGTYTSALSTTYVVTVTRGGHYSDAAPPRISVATTTGVDISGPTIVPAAGTPVDVGTQGVEVAFSGTGLRAGDVYYIECLGTSVGPVRTLILANNLDTTIAGGSQVDLTLYIRNPALRVGGNRDGFAPLTNWDVDAEKITIRQGIIGYDPSWTEGGVPQPLPVIAEPAKHYGLQFVEYRAWLPNLSASIGSVSDIGDLDAAIGGALDIDNPLKWGVAQALGNANGTPVYFTAVADPGDPASWTDVLSLLIGHEETYGLVPLTHDKTVLDLYHAHVGAQSSADNGLWRTLWVNLQGVPEVPLVSAGSAVVGYLGATTTDGQVALAVVEQDPDAVGTAYTIVRVTSGNAGFLVNKVIPGDIVRALYAGDGFGRTTFVQFVVAAVTSEEELRLVAGPAAPVNVASKIEVWRNQTPGEEAASIALNAGSWGDRRVRATWPDRIGAGGTLMDGIFLNCALAGLASGILPQQGMTHLAVAGFDDLSRTTRHFNRTQLDTMAVAGAWIVTQDRVSGQVFTRHAVTTGLDANVNSREEMITRNVDSVSFQLKEFFAPYIGVANVTPTVQGEISLALTGLIDTLKSTAINLDLGPQLIAATIKSFTPSLIDATRYVVVLACQFPAPLNVLEVHLVV